MRRAIIAAGGWAHPGDDIVDAASDLIKPHDFHQIDVVLDTASFVRALETPCDLLVVGACWFSMSDARYDDDQRAEHAVELTPELLDCLREKYDAGCPLLALHTAVICFDGSQVWRDWLGGVWNWQTSFHPPPEPMNVSPTDLLSFEPFTVTDELYQGLDVNAQVSVVAQSDAGQPLAWIQETPAGRSAVNLLGHDRRSLADAHHRALNERLLTWLLSNE